MFAICPNCGFNFGFQLSEDYWCECGCEFSFDYNGEYFIYHQWEICEICGEDWDSFNYSSCSECDG